MPISVQKAWEMMKKESIAHFDKLVDVLIRNDVKDSSN